MSHGNLSLKVFKLPNLLLQSSLAVRLNDCLAKWLHNENALSLPRIEISFWCRTWAGLSLLSVTVQKPAVTCVRSKDPYVDLYGAFTVYRLFIYALQRRTLLLLGARLRPTHPHVFSSVSPADADKLLTICPFSVRDGIKPGEDKPVREGDKVTVGFTENYCGEVVTSVETGFYGWKWKRFLKKKKKVRRSDVSCFPKFHFARLCLYVLIWISHSSSRSGLNTQFYQVRVLFLML